MNPYTLVIIIIYLVVLSFVLVLSIKFRSKFWNLYGSALFPVLLAAIFIYNLVSFPSINQPYFNWAYQGVLQQLPSNELIDLFKRTPLRAEWIYALIEDYYLGRTLFIPESELSSLELSLDSLRSQGRLANVITIESDGKLTEDEVELILGLEHVDVSTREVDLNNNITATEGDIYYFITEEKDPDSPLLLLRYENQVFIIPEDLLPIPEGGL